MPVELPSSVREIIDQYQLRLDARTPHVQLESGHFLFATPTHLVMVSPDGHTPVLTVEGETKSQPPTSDCQVCDTSGWSSIQKVSWDAPSRVLTVTWVDPSWLPWKVVTTSTDPEKFMRSVTAYINHSMVLHRRVTTDNGRTIAVQVRRGDLGQLFTITTADGPLTDEGQALAAQMEQAAMEELGLDN